MQRFERKLTETHCVGAEWPTFCGTVAPGESFVIETTEDVPNGPVEVSGISAGEVICISVEKIEIEPPYYAPQSGPFFLGCGERIPLTYEAGWFRWPNHFRLQAKPSIGNVAVLPEQDEEIRELCRYRIYGPRPLDRSKRGWRKIVRDTRGKHCHQDCAAANTIVATAGDIINCALYGLGENYIPQDRGKQPYDLALVAAVPKSIFVDQI